MTPRPCSLLVILCAAGTVSWGKSGPSPELAANGETEVTAKLTAIGGDRTLRPCDALTPRRLMETWYPTDVDTGALHLSRLKALEPSGALTTYMLNDHEDNLFFRGWGMANEPVYNPSTPPHTCCGTK